MNFSQNMIKVMFFLKRLAVVGLQLRALLPAYFEYKRAKYLNSALLSFNM